MRTVVDTKSSESASQLEVKSQAETGNVMKLEQEYPIKDLKYVEETTSILENFPSERSVWKGFSQGKIGINE
ncbi:hypothetical protein L1887_45899 [Cichorium endivia]|nr:hypothetical protein L1887_45899 [Cichorium endivia]